ncbi:hypothetical protein [Pedosphaera parvula]|uniref:Uncharacterized protein n=1 Tax=Pedosphaera parvula (strain Ellin514) TaxID=320771 RepID=B9XGU7_PEDPL|nr:hypothetical protein [Pedosphaera parvula]EEF60868.1 conserved hypothetical protein [Pedosphaera parvula Ellin514]
MRRPYFVNVDLCLKSKSTLRTLARELGNKVMVMFSGRIKGHHCLFVEIAGTRKGPNKAIAALCELIEGLSPAGMRVWKAAQSKKFDVGYEARLSSQPSNSIKLRPSTVRRLASLGASLAVTFYREEKEEASDSAKSPDVYAKQKRR